MYAQTPEVGEQPVKKLLSQSSLFNIYIYFFKNVRQDGYTKTKRSVCDLTHRIFSTRPFNLLRPKLHPLHPRLINISTSTKTLISYISSKKTKRDNAQKRMYSLSKLIYIINNLVAKCYFHS